METTSLWWKEGVILKEYKKMGQIKYFPIKKIDLMDLSELIARNDFSDENFSISAKIDTLSITEISIEAFLAHKEVPDPLFNYEISCTKFNSNYELEKRASLYVENKYSSILSVSGLDETWVLGKFLQINEFINRKFELYEEEQKRIEKDNAVAVEYKDREIIVTETILQKFGRSSQLEKIVAIATVVAVVIAALQLISMWL